MYMSYLFYYVHKEVNEMKIYEEQWRGWHEYHKVYDNMDKVFRLVCRGDINPENLFFEYSTTSDPDRKTIVEGFLDISLMSSKEKIPSGVDYDGLIVEMLKKLDYEIENRKIYSEEDDEDIITDYELFKRDMVTLNNISYLYTDALLEKGIVKCPKCGAVLNGEDTMYRTLIPDNNYFGLLDGEVKEIFEEMMAPPQNMYTELACVKCKENVEDYLLELEDEGKLILSLY